MIYYMDANAPENDLISIYENKIDMLQTEQYRQKFIDWLNIEAEISSPFKSMINGFRTLEDTDKFNTCSFNTEFSTQIKEAMTRFSRFKEACVNELFVELMNQGRPGPNNVSAHKNRIAQTVQALLKELSDTTYTKLIIPQEDKHFISRVYELRHANACRGQRPLIDVDQYIQDVGIARYFDRKIAQREVGELLLFRGVANNDGGGGDFKWEELDAFADLHEKMLKTLSGFLRQLVNQDAKDLSFSAEETAAYPKIIPVKCKLLIDRNIQKMSESHILTKEDMKLLLEHKYKALRITPEVNAGTCRGEVVVIKDPGLVRILDGKEAENRGGRDD